MNMVGDSILKVVVRDARAAGVLGSNRPMSVNPPIGFTLEYDDHANMWFIPTNPRTFNIRERLKGLGFKWNQGDKTWDVQSLTPDIRREFGMVTGSDASRIETWFAEWLSQNIHRFTRIFTDYARNKQSSYALVFTVSNGKAQVSFERDVDTPAKAVEEIRYRYQGRQGREPWLEVIDRFIDLVDVRNPHHVQQLIDRINNLQHSNGLFMEHFPSKVQEWYGGFLNAKFHTPTADELAKQIPDRDLRGLLVEVARNGRRSMDWMYTPTPAYAQMRKELADVGNNVNYRALGYPRPKGMPPVDRFDPEIQSRLDVLQALDTQRERILSTEVASPKQEQAVVEQAHDWAVDREQALESLRAALEAQRRRKLDDPNHAAAWDAINFPDEFIARFPYAVPGASSSELAQFVARYAALGFARR